MQVYHTEKAIEVKNVVALMAIEDMYLSNEFVKELLKVANGQKTSEELRLEDLHKSESKDKK